MIRVLVPLTLLVILVGCAAAEDVTLVREGRPAAVIVIPDSPVQVVEYAARELTHHVRKASGAELETVREGDLGDRPGARVFIGDCATTRAAGIDVTALPPEGWVIRTVGDALYLAGRDTSG